MNFHIIGYYMAKQVIIIGGEGNGVAAHVFKICVTIMILMNTKCMGF